MRIVKDYMRDEIMRHALNALTQEIFGFDFESWVTDGYYEGDYIPYSLEENGKILSNVSANITTFEQNGETKNYIQLGTVMTDEDYRKKGLAQELMEHVIKEYEDKCDGIYLFGDLSALEFYKKLGFEIKMQYTYTLKESTRINLPNQLSEGSVKEGFQAVDTSDATIRQSYMDSVRNSVSNGAFEQINKYGLQMFYTADLEDVYYSKTLDCFIVMDVMDDTIEIHSIISKKQIPMDQIIGEINLEDKVLKLGFTPRKEDAHLFECAMYDGGEDYRLFCRGEQLDSIEKEKLYFPTFSHA